jgi:hypothetical protein
VAATLIRLHPAPAPRLRPEQRRRTPVAGRRPRVAVVGRRGSPALSVDDVRRIAQRADVTFHALDEAPDRATAARLLRGVDVLAAADGCLPVLDDAFFAAAPTLRTVVPEHDRRVWGQHILDAVS